MRNGLLQGFSLSGYDERKVVMKREPFLELVREALDSLPRKFRNHIHNVAVVIGHHALEGRDPNDLLMGVFEGTPRTEQSFSARIGKRRRVLASTLKRTAQGEPLPGSAMTFLSNRIESTEPSKLNTMPALSRKDGRYSPRVFSANRSQSGARQAVQQHCVVPGCLF